MHMYVDYRGVGDGNDRVKCPILMNSYLCVDRRSGKWWMCAVLNRNIETITNKQPWLSRRNSWVQCGVCLRQAFGLWSYAPNVKKDKCVFDFLVAGCVGLVGGALSLKPNLLKKCEWDWKCLSVSLTEGVSTLEPIIKLPRREANTKVIGQKVMQLMWERCLDGNSKIQRATRMTCSKTKTVRGGVEEMHRPLQLKCSGTCIKCLLRCEHGPEEREYLGSVLMRMLT